MTQRNHRLRLGTIALMFVPILAACGGASTPSNSAPAETSATTQAATLAPTDSVALVTATADQVEPVATVAPVAEPTVAATTAPTVVPASEPTEVPATVDVTAVETAKLNLNEASGDDYLSAIPGFSNRMVREFLEYRPYVSIRQFRQEIGKYVDDAQIAEYEKYVYVPVSADESDAETLKQLPGVDDPVAADLIAGRPYGSNDAFLAKLATLVSSSQAAEAQAYLAQ